MFEPAPDSDMASQTYSFLDPDPVITRNESRLQILEQALRAAEAHAQGAVDRSLEHEEDLRNLTASAERAEMSRQLETQELERRLLSERSAKHEKQMQIQVLASQTQDLHARMELQAQQAAQREQLIAALSMQVASAPVMPVDVHLPSGSASSDRL